MSTRSPVHTRGPAVENFGLSETAGEVSFNIGGPAIDAMYDMGSPRSYLLIYSQSLFMSVS